MPAIFGVVFAALILSIMWMDQQQQESDQMIYRFEARCAQQGGVTLKGVGHGSLNWLGCYKGLTEVYNEE